MNILALAATEKYKLPVSSELINEQLKNFDVVVAQLIVDDGCQSYVYLHSKYIRRKLVKELKAHKFSINNLNLSNNSPADCQKNNDQNLFMSFRVFVDSEEIFDHLPSPDFQIFDPETSYPDLFGKEGDPGINFN